MSLSSLSLDVDGDKYFSFNIPGLAKMETDESLSVLANMPGVKKEHVKACVEERRSLLSIQGQKYGESYSGRKVTYFAYMGLPNNVYDTCVINTEMPQDGMFEVTLPKLKDQEFKNTNFFTNICYALVFRFALSFYSSIPSGKTKAKKNMVTGIRLPESFKTKRNMIKTELQDGLFKITVPRADAKTNILSSIIVDFISKRTCSLHGSDGWTSRIFTRLNRWTFK